MDPVAFCRQARVLIVAGKGGVGKTTVTAALARMAADHGLRTLIVEVEGTSGLPTLFGHDGPLSYHPTVLSPADPATGRAEVAARTLTPDDALVEYLEDHGLRRVSKRLAASGTLDLVATAVPGIRDILVLGKVRQLEGAGVADLVVVDGPAAGHAVTFLASAHGLLDAVNVGPIRTQATEVVELLSDPTRCQVLLVTLPEETPVNEVVETAFHLEDRAGVQLAPVVVNALITARDLPADALAEATGAGLDPVTGGRLAAAARFRRLRQELQAEQVERLGADLPLPQIVLPFLFTTEIGLDDLDVLAAALARGIEALPDPVTA